MAYAELQFLLILMFRRAIHLSIYVCIHVCFIRMDHSWMGLSIYGFRIWDQLMTNFEGKIFLVVLLLC